MCGKLTAVHAGRHPVATEGEFLRLLQMAESVRRCEGRICLEVNDMHVQLGQAVEVIRSAHAPETALDGHLSAMCDECGAIQMQQIALRETMHSEGVDFPMGLLES